MCNVRFLSIVFPLNYPTTSFYWYAATIFSSNVLLFLQANFHSLYVQEFSFLVRLFTITSRSQTKQLGRQYNARRFNCNE